MNRIWRVISLIFLLGLVCAGGCSDDGGLRPPIMPVPDVPIEELSNAPVMLEIGGYSFELETYLWRDFMPISPPDGKPLISLIHVVEMNQEKIPEGFSAEYLWVLNDGKIWATTFSDETRPPSPDYMQERVARNGPKWGPNIKVDVVVGIITESRDLWLIRAPDQWIYRTE